MISIEKHGWNVCHWCSVYDYHIAERVISKYSCCNGPILYDPEVRAFVLIFFLYFRNSWFGFQCFVPLFIFLRSTLSKYIDCQFLLNYPVSVYTTSIWYVIRCVWDFYHLLCVARNPTARLPINEYIDDIIIERRSSPRQVTPWTKYEPRESKCICSPNHYTNFSSL